MLRVTRTELKRKHSCFTREHRANKGEQRENMITTIPKLALTQLGRK